MMELAQYFKSMAEQDSCAVVICNTQHEIIYMNPAAKSQYTKYGGGNLVGQSLLTCHSAESARMIEKVAAWFAESVEHNRIYTFHNEKQNKDVYMVALRGEDGALIGYYEKHEYRDPETRKTYCFEEPEKPQ